MNFTELHPWPRDVRAAIMLQHELAAQVQLCPPAEWEWENIAGADVSCTRFSRKVWATVVVLRRSDRKILETVGVEQDEDFPYIPGLLAFREIPAILHAFHQLQTVPDVVLCDGQGIAHPRFLGLAAHLGLWLQKPTIGCAKTRLVGDYVEPGSEPGDWSPLFYKETQVGVVVRTRAKARPLFVSPGHLMSFELARKLVQACCWRGKIPEPIRLAHLAANAYRTGKIKIM